MENARSLRNSENWKDTYISPDLTRMQRQEKYELRQELKLRREGGESNLIIRRGRVVQMSERSTNLKERKTKGEENEALASTLRNTQAESRRNQNAPDPQSSVEMSRQSSDSEVELLGAVGGSEDDVQ